jgi:hypothetical protein
VSGAPRRVAPRRDVLATDLAARGIDCRAVVADPVPRGSDGHTRRLETRFLLAEGQQADVAAYLNRDLLVSQWPVLRTLIGRTVRGVWESAFPELREGQAAEP